MQQGRCLKVAVSHLSNGDVGWGGSAPSEHPGLQPPILSLLWSLQPSVHQRVSVLTGRGAALVAQTLASEPGGSKPAALRPKVAGMQTGPLQGSSSMEVIHLFQKTAFFPISVMSGSKRKNTHVVQKVR